MIWFVLQTICFIITKINAQTYICNNGYYLSSGVCTACPVNIWCKNDTYNLCPVGSTSPTLSYSITQCLCKAGYYRYNNECRKCGPGQYQTGVNATFCFTCGAGTYSTSYGATLASTCATCNTIACSSTQYENPPCTPTSNKVCSACIGQQCRRAEQIVVTPYNDVYTFTVPYGVTQLYTKMWGGGGGAKAAGAFWPQVTGNGGAGGYGECILTVTAGTSITISAGRAGRMAIYDNTGAQGQGATGGSKSELLANGVRWMTVGGGGGGGAARTSPGGFCGASGSTGLHGGSGGGGNANGLTCTGATITNNGGTCIIGTGLKGSGTPGVVNGTCNVPTTSAYVYSESYSTGGDGCNSGDKGTVYSIPWVLVNCGGGGAGYINTAVCGSLVSQTQTQNTNTALKTAFAPSGYSIMGQGGTTTVGSEEGVDGLVYVQYCIGQHVVGTVNSANGYVTCSCKAGYFYNGTACQTCPVGTYGATTELSVCQSCAAGTYGTTIGLTVCVSCSVGTYSVTVGASLSSVCTSCVAGKYSLTVGASLASVCTSCAAGTYSTQLGASLASACTNCAAGKYAINVGSSTCTGCVVGKYSITAGASLASVCTSCSIGMSATATGLSACTYCTGGTFANITGLSACYSCKTGSWSVEGATLCTGCTPLAQPAITTNTPTTDVMGFYVHAFPYTGNNTDYNFPRNVIADVLVIGGGGGAQKGGGGAGAVIYASNILFKSGQQYTFSVGAGGSGANGENSYIYGSGVSVTALGGGAGGVYGCGAGSTGASGGGAGSSNGACTGIGGSSSNLNVLYTFSNWFFGTSGGSGYGSSTTSWRNSGGGGGNGAAGVNAGSIPGNGGYGVHSVTWAGKTLSFAALFGSAYKTVAKLESDGLYYVGGGGGGGGWSVIGYGGWGGGGTAAQGLDGTGGGGGAISGSSNAGGRGGHGLILVRYSKCQSCPANQRPCGYGSAGCCYCTDSFPNTWSQWGSSACLPCPTNSVSYKGSCTGLQGYSLSYAGAVSLSTSQDIAISFPNTFYYYSTTGSSYWGYTSAYFMKANSGTFVISDGVPVVYNTNTNPVYIVSSLAFSACTGTCTGGQPHCAPGGTTKVCCGPGYYFKDGYSTECVACSANYFSPTGAATACTACAGGLFSDVNASACRSCTTTQTCTANQTRYCTSSTSNVCCGAGKYFPGGSTACVTCPAGFFTVDGSKDQCDSCSPGKYSLAGSSTCTNCPVGYFQDQEEQSACFLCNRGTYSTAIGADMCIDCPSGSACPGGSAINTCQGGATFSLQNQGTCTNCSTCLPGSYLSADCIVTQDSACVVCDQGVCKLTLTIREHCAAGIFSA
jgi:hypothetical protein